MLDQNTKDSFGFDCSFLSKNTEKLHGFSSINYSNQDPKKIRFKLKWKWISKNLDLDFLNVYSPLSLKNPCLKYLDKESSLSYAMCQERKTLTCQLFHK